MRRLALVAALCIASNASAQRSGLLLGFSGDSGYRTRWIAPVEGKVIEAARLPMLVVPRADGFHHLGIVRECSVQESGERPESGPYQNQADRLIDLPLGSPAAVVDSARTGCDAVARYLGAHADSVARVDSIRLATARTAEDSLAAQPEGDDESDVCGFDELTITYASSRHVSTYESIGSTEYCNPGRYTSSEHRHVQRMDSGDVALLPLLPVSRQRAIRRQWERMKGDCALEDSPDENWGIVRALGEWRVEFSVSGPTVCRGMAGPEDGFGIVQRVPATLARRDPVDRWLPGLRSLFPKLDDVFVSPSSDLVVARVGNRLEAFVPRGAELGAPVLTVEIGGTATVVMAEWATGAYVDRWTTRLRSVNERW